MSSKGLIQVKVFESVYNSSKKGKFFIPDQTGKRKGCLEVDSDGGYFCREEVFWDYLLSEGDRGKYHLYFLVDDSRKIKNAQKLFKFIEDKLKLAPSSRIKILNTTNNKFTKIVFGKWWSLNWARRDLVTAILRAATLPGSNAQKIKNCTYLDEGNSTLREAFNLFLKGYNKVERFNKLKLDYGWRDTFSFKENHKFLKKQLTRK